MSWNLNKCSWVFINLSLAISLSIGFKLDALVPGLGLNINEYELINLIFFIKFTVSLKSLSVSPGYEIIKSLENSMLGLIFISFS